MVKTNGSITRNKEKAIDIEAWLKELSIPDEKADLLKRVYRFAAEKLQAAKQDDSSLVKGLKIAEILFEMNFDSESLAVSILYPAADLAAIPLDKIESGLDSGITSLLRNTQALELMSGLHQTHYDAQQLNTIRKMFLAMVRDVRAVAIKLAERLYLMREIKKIMSADKRRIAQETMDIFAPLANRLGLHSLKWQLEDLAFMSLEPETYKSIAKKLEEKRREREARVSRHIELLRETFKQRGIKADVKGRAKHIYSIRKKMLRKNVDLSQIYDVIAVRVLVSTVDECYKVLSIVHDLFTSIPEEFDDYISNPKPNGYQSIHTALLDEDNKTFEVQIRTRKMHEFSEKGVASHWAYKEGGKASVDYEQKIAWLRSLLDWQRHLTKEKAPLKEIEKALFEDRIYVFTPAGDILDLAHDATPLDFAYAIHTDIGHRCRGAKVNGKIVHLNSALRTGDRVEVITGKEKKPSRDWLIAKLGYVKSPSAKQKILAWFKKQEQDQNIVEGKHALEQALHRLDIPKADFREIAAQLNYKSADGFFIAFSKGDIKLSTILQIVQPEIKISKEKEIAEIPIALPKKRKAKNDIIIFGLEDLLTRTAECCKPVPGDAIVGYVTKHQAIAIHRQNCPNIIHTSDQQRDRLIEAEWNTEIKNLYSADLELDVIDTPKLIHDITTILSGEKISLSGLHTVKNKAHHAVKLFLTLEVNDVSMLDKVRAELQKITDVKNVRRL